MQLVDSKVNPKDTIFYLSDLMEAIWWKDILDTIFLMMQQSFPYCIKYLLPLTYILF